MVVGYTWDRFELTKHLTRIDLFTMFVSSL